MLYKIIDAARPPQTAPPGVRGVLFNIGGANTTFVPSLQDWLRFSGLHQFPNWVPLLDQDPVAQAREACAVAHSMGWLADGTRALVCDTEAAADRAWYQSWKAEVGRLGFLEANYGSLGTPQHPIVEINGSRRIWAAHWDGDPILEGGQDVEAHQYAADVPWEGTQVDLSVMEHSLFILGGRGPRRAGP